MAEPSSGGRTGRTRASLGQAGLDAHAAQEIWCRRLQGSPRRPPGAADARGDPPGRSPPRSSRVGSRFRRSAHPSDPGPGADAEKGPLRPSRAGGRRSVSHEALRRCRRSAPAPLPRHEPAFLAGGAGPCVAETGGSSRGTLIIFAAFAAAEGSGSFLDRGRSRPAHPSIGVQFAVSSRVLQEPLLPGGKSQTKGR
jgi:hypothetical protein